MIHIVDLELASPCNAKCSFCPQKFHGVLRQAPFLSENLLDKITAETGELAREEPVLVVLCGMGENLLRKDLVVRALENLGRAGGGKNLRTLLVTNGSKLTPDLLDHPAFNTLGAIQVSFTGYGKQAYESIFRLDHHEVVTNVEAMARALPGRVYLRTVDLESERHTKKDAEAFWAKRGVPVTYRPLHSRGGHIVDPEAYRGPFRSFEKCEIFDWITFVSSDGLVLSCCHDVTSAHVIGDLQTMTLREAMAKKQALRAERFTGFEICRRCTDFELAGGLPAQGL